MDPILEKVKQGVESKLPPQAKDAFDRIVVAGMKILFTPSTHAVVQTLYQKVRQGGFQPQAIATGMVNFLGMIYKASQGKMSVSVAYPAGVVLLCYVLDDLEKTQGLTVTEPLVKEVGKIMAQQIMTMLKSGGQPAQPGTQPTPPQPSAQPAMGGA
jgi:hypothetical protein